MKPERLALVNVVVVPDRPDHAIEVPLPELITLLVAAEVACIVPVTHPADASDMAANCSTVRLVGYQVDFRVPDYFVGDETVSFLDRVVGVDVLFTGHLFLIRFVAC